MTTIRPEPREPQPSLFVLGACIVIVISLFLLNGTSCGQDFDFHLQSWMEAARHWSQNVLYPHWMASANYGAGEPRFVFYPPLSWTLGAFLGTFFPWTWTPILFVTLCLLGMGAACYAMASEWMPTYDAEIATCLYVVSPYIFFVVYERSALGELLAAVWLPLLVLYALRRRPSTPQLALTVAALWLTDAPVAVMSSYALVVIAVVGAINQRRWTLLVRAAIAMALGLGIAAVYLIPALYEQRWIQISRVLMPGMRVQDSFLFGHTGLAYHDLVLHTASWIGFLLLVATAIAAIASLLVRRPEPLRAPILALAAFIAFLLFPISNFVWNVAPEMRFMQFPWRWLLLLGLAFAVLAGIGLRESIPSRNDKILRMAFIFAFAAFFAHHAAGHFWLTCDEEDNVHAQVAALHHQGFQGTDEYTPDSADTGDIQQNLAPVRVLYTPDGDDVDSTLGKNPDWQPNMDDLQPAIIQIARSESEHLTAEVQAPQAGYAVLRLMDYPAWRVRVNNNLIRNRFRRHDGLITVPIPAGTSTIDVQYIATPDVWLGRVVSLLSLAIWLPLWFLTTAKTRRQRV